MVLEAMTILEEQEPVLVDLGRVDGRGRRRFAMRIGDEQRIIEQRRRIDLTAGERQSEQDAIELPAMQRLAGSTAGLFPEVELEFRPLLAKPRQHCWKKERRDRRDDAHTQ